MGMSNTALYQNDDDEMCVTNADGTALSSVDLLRHFCLNNVLFERQGPFLIDDQNMLPKDFQVYIK
jgi:hypothetical protein